MTKSWSCVNTNFYGRNKVKSMESLADKVRLNFPEKGTKRLGNISKLENSSWRSTFQSSGIPEGENRINGEGNNSVTKIQEHVPEMKETSVQIKKTQTKVAGCEISLNWGQKKTRLPERKSDITYRIQNQNNIRLPNS